MSSGAERIAESAATTGINGLSPIVRTKIVPPATNRMRIERSRLLDRLSATGQRRLILLKAPAGYGKTTLAVDWREQLQHSGAITAWLTLDDSDNEPGTFAFHLGNALHCAAPTVGQSAVDLLAEARLIDSRSVMSAAITGVAENDAEIYLFLDDYHAISDERAHALTTFLLRHTPSNFHLVLMSRTEPSLQISALRLSDEIAELDSESLRFTLDETAQFLGSELTPQLAATDVSKLHEATEGWPAALQLARITIRNSSDPTSTLRSFSGTSRQISAYIHDTLTTQADEIVDFLLRTAILDRLNGSLCQAVTGIPRSAELLRALDHQQLLLVTLNEREGWYRYHHLMGDYLLDRLRTRLPDQIPELHRRAYGWYAARQMWPQAVHHAIAAGDHKQALAFIRQCAMELVYKGDLLTLLAWDRNLPADLTRGQVDIKLALAWGLTLVCRFAEANSLLKSVEEHAGADRDSELWARCVFVRAALMGLLDDSAGGLKHLEDHLPAGVYDMHSLNGRNVTRYAHWKAARWDEFYAVPIHDARDEAANVTAETYRLFFYGMAAAQKLQFDEAMTHYVEARERAIKYAGAKSIFAAATTGMIAELRYERGEVGPAEVAVLDELGVIDTATFHESFLRAHTVLVRAAALRKDFARALKLVGRAERLATDRGWSRVVAVFRLKRIRLLLREGRLEEAQAALNRLKVIADEHPTPERCAWSHIHVCVAVAEGVLALATGKAGRAVGHLTSAFDELIATDNRHEALRVGLDLANAHFRAGSSAKSHEVLHAILEWAERAKATSFLAERPDEMLQLLASARRSATICTEPQLCRLIDGVLADSAVGREALREPVHEQARGRAVLSRRECAIIEFIASGQSNKEIARTLGVTPETIKTHVKRIFVKLSAETRAQAVVRAQSLGLLRNAEVG